MTTLKRASSINASKIFGNPIFSQFSQQVSQDGKQADMFFVLPPGKQEDDCGGTNLGEMFQICRANFLPVRWLKDEDCNDSLVFEEGSIFIFDPFGSPGYENLLKRLEKCLPRFEIFGPQVLRSVFNAPDILQFTTLFHPTYALAMRKMIISLSGFSRDLKLELEQLIRLMNGTISPSLTKSVTHVVTDNAITNKSLEASREQIPIMTTEWVKKVWEDNQSKPVQASDPRYANYFCPLFYKVKVCLSQISATKKATLKAGIERLGGTCSPDLVKGTTDVLVVTNAAGDKYKFAKKWKIPCVSPDWVENSTDQGILLPFDNFKVIPDDLDLAAMMSTPAHSHVPDLDFNLTRFSVVDDDRSKLIINATTDFSHNRTESHSDALVQLRAASKNTGSYLDGCRIYVVDYENCDELKRVLNTSGAVRLNQLSNGVTHVIVTRDKLPKQVQDRLNDLEPMPYLVTIGWLLESAKQGNPADEDMHKFEAVLNICQESFVTPVQPVQARRSVPPLTNSSSTRQSVTNSHRGGESGGTERSSSGAATVTDNSTEDSTTHDGNSPTNINITTNTENEEAGIFVGISFKVALTDEKERGASEEVILENGGTLKEHNPDVMILPTVCDQRLKDEANQCYTKYWLTDCLENKSLDATNSFTYVPMVSFKRMSEVMKNVVVAISQYPLPAEREYMVELLKAMGGRYQDVFAKKDAADGRNLRSTHLVCKSTDNDKAKAAKRWGVPIVVAEWIVDSFLQHKRLDEEQYNPENQSSSYPTVYMPTPKRKQANKLKNSMMSVRSVYPPSDRKAAPNQIIKTRTPDPDEVLEANGVESESTNANTAKPDPTNIARNVFLTPPVPSTSNKRHNLSSSTNEGRTDEEEDSFLRGLPKCPSQGEIDRVMAELKALDPYTDESFERMMENLKARGINIDDYSPFTSMEERRLCDPNPDSPLLLGLPRHESRALKEQYEIALGFTPGNKIKLKQRTSTPLSELVERFNSAARRREPDSMSESPSQMQSPRTSTPKTNGTPLRKIAAINRHSQGGSGSTLHNQLEVIDPLAGIRRLSNKRPSDGSPEAENDSKSNKRARTSSESENADIVVYETQPSPIKDNVEVAENVGKETVEKPKPSTSKLSNSMKNLNNLIAQTEAEQNESEEGTSPTKRRPGSGSVKQLVPVDVEEQVCEEIEQPHLSWADDDQPTNGKMSTVKKVPPKPIIEPQPKVQENTERGSRKRSSRLKKAGSVVSVEDGVRTTRSTRSARSQSKTREDTVPVGHQPIKVDKGRKSKRSKANAFPIILPDAPKFMVSSMSEAEKTKAMEMASQLGGSISGEAFFDPHCVGLITGSLIRSEKVLCCIASGKCILKTEYLKRSVDAGKFLPVDEEFVWNENNINQEKERELAKASYSWLKAQLQNKTNKPMFGMKFLILDQPPVKLEAFTRVVLSGGGEVVTSVEDATYVLKDEKSKSTQVIPKGIQVKNPMFLNTLILTDPTSTT